MKHGNYISIINSKNKQMKNLLLSIAVLFCFSFGKKEKSITVEQAIETYYNSAAAYDHATTDAQRTTARNMVVGVMNPLDFNDPDLQSKVETFLATKMDNGCVGAAATCYMQFIDCIKHAPPCPRELSCPPPPWCYTTMSACMGAHCGIPL